MAPAVHTSPIIFSASMIRALLDGRKTQTRRLITSQWANVKMHHELGERCLLWVREKAWLPPACPGHVTYATDHGPDRVLRWTPSIHMPRWASRLTLELADVRIQRLQDISESDARAEGDPHQGLIASENTHSDWYRSLWESLHGEGSWVPNPEIIAFTFRVQQQNVDAMIGQCATS